MKNTYVLKEDIQRGIAYQKEAVASSRILGSCEDVGIDQWFSVLAAH